MLEIPLATLAFCAQRFSHFVKSCVAFFVYVQIKHCLSFSFGAFTPLFWCAWCAFWEAIPLNHWATKDVDNQFEFNKKQRRSLSADDDNQFGHNNIRSLVIGDDDDDN